MNDRWLTIGLIVAITIGGCSLIPWNLYLTYQLNTLENFVHDTSAKRGEQMVDVLSSLRRIEQRLGTRTSP